MLSRVVPAMGVTMFLSWPVMRLIKELLCLVLIDVVEILHHDIQQVAGAAACHAGNGMGFTQAQAIELGEVVHLFRIVHLVGYQQHFLLAFAKQCGHVLVHWCETVACVDKEKDDIGFLDGQLHLFAYLHFELIVSAHYISACVDD